MNFFNPDHFLWRFFAKLADLFLLSCCWMLCCIPLVTVGSACIALYDSVSRCIRGDEGGTYKRFFRTFKAELKRGIPLTLLWVAIGLLLSFGYQIMYQNAGSSDVWAVATMVYYVLLLFPIAIVCWIVALESRFIYGFGKLHHVAAVLAIAKLPTSVLVVALLLVGFELSVLFPFLLMLLPALICYIQSYFIEKVFQTMMPAQDAPAEAEEEIP